MKKFVWGVWLAIVILGLILGILYNYLWPVIIILSIIIGLIVLWSSRKTKWVQVIFFLILIILVIFLVKSDFYPKSGSLKSYSEFHIPLLARLLSNGADYIEISGSYPPDEDMEKERFEQSCFQYMSQARSSEHSGILISEARKILNALRKMEEKNIDLSKLSSAIEELDRVIKSRFSSLTDLRSKVRDLETFLDSSRAKRSQMKADELADFEKDFKLQVLHYSLESEYGHMEKLLYELDNSISQVLSSKISVGSTLSTKLNEESNNWILEETISITPNPSIALTRIDVSELKLETKIKQFNQEIAIYYEDPKDSRIKEEMSFAVNRDAPQVFVKNQFSIPANINELSTSFKPANMKYTLLRWPNPFPVKLKLSLDLTKLELAEEYTHFVVLERDNPIETIELPEYSYYTSAYEFKRIHRSNSDILVTSSKELRPSYFRTHNNIWLELLPENYLFRNPIIQKYKEMIISENLLTLLTILLVTTFFTTIVFKKDHNG